MVSGQFNAFTTYDYEFTDPLPAEGANYYRLKQVDIDGRYSHNKIVLIPFQDPNLQSLKMYPVPVGNLLTVSFRSPVTDLPINVYGFDG